jgi:hypothetical protein
MRLLQKHHSEEGGASQRLQFKEQLESCCVRVLKILYAIDYRQTVTTGIILRRLGPLPSPSTP